MATPQPPPTTLHDPRDPATLLCEACGYIIEGLARESVCPECGRPVAESLPERRAGTPWQNRGPGLTGSTLSMLQTNVKVVRKPRTIWSSVRPTSPTWIRLSHANALVCSMIVACAAGLLFFGALPRDSRMPMTRDVKGLFVGLATSVTTLPVLILLMWVEHRGIRTFGSLRQWRISPAVARAVVDHASVGWLAGAIPTLPIVGLFVVGIIDAVTTAVAFAALAALGLLTFETLVYIGFRSMRYANQHRDPR